MLLRHRADFGLTLLVVGGKLHEEIDQDYHHHHYDDDDESISGGSSVSELDFAEQIQAQVVQAQSKSQP